ncbi:MAG: dihydroneopterin aldolase [Vampirovibrionales bacterium]
MSSSTSYPVSHNEPFEGWDLKTFALANPFHTPLPELQRILVTDWTLPLPVGILEEEQHRHQPIRINAIVLVKAFDSHNPEASITTVFDYRQLLDAFLKAQETHHNLLETLCDTAWASIKSSPSVVGLTVRIEKTSLLPNATALGIERTYLK